MIRVSDGKNNLEFDKNLVSGHIANFVLDIDENNLKELGINAKKEKYMEALVALNEVVEGLTEDKLKEILDHLPKTKAGMVKSGKTPLYTTGLSFYDGYRATSIELTVMQKISGYKENINGWFETPIREKGEYYIDFTSDEREYSKKDIPVINRDLTFNSLEIKRHSYIKPEDLVIGKIYKDAKDRQFLYLGKIFFNDVYHGIIHDGSEQYMMSTYFDLDINKDQDYELDPEDIDIENHLNTNVFYKITKKNKKELQACANFGEYMQKFLDDFYTKEIFLTSSFPFKCASSFKVCEEVETLFAPEDMICSVRSGFAKGKNPDSDRYDSEEIKNKTYLESVFKVVE